MATSTRRPGIYDGEGDRLMLGLANSNERLVVLPDTVPSREPDPRPHLRVMWGQHLLEDLLAGRYHSVVCGVNTVDNSVSTIGRLAKLLPTSQWDAQSITDHARRFGEMRTVTVIKYDMDAVEVLALLRPKGKECLTLEDLQLAFKMVAEMVHRKPQRLPSASVSFLGSRTNPLRNADGSEPSLEAVLRMMYRTGYLGDVYPAPSMWESGTPVYARYPFPQSLEQMRDGGF
jgi:hypothetical protein